MSNSNLVNYVKLSPNHSGLKKKQNRYNYYPSHGG